MITYSLLTSMYIFNICYARLYYVHPDSTHNSIQEALNLCSKEDTVMVSPGTYIENIIWPDVNGIALLSEHGPDSTTIDGAYEDCVIRFTSPSLIKDSSTIIAGFTICHGSCINGGGINCAVWHSPTIKGNIICDNQAYVGAGIYSDGGIDSRFGGPLVIDNEIKNNQALYAGGGICCVYESCPVIRDNTIAGNSAQFGGGICAHSYSHAYIVSNTICNNNATYGGGVHCSRRCNTIIDSCTISGNNYAGVYFDTIDNGTPLLRFNDIMNNTGYGIYSDGSSQAIEAVNNWWGDASGPYHPITNPNGHGDTISYHIHYTPWLHICMHCLGIAEYKQEKNLIVHPDIQPNPFIHSTNIRYTIHDTRSTIQTTTFTISDVTGRVVKSFNDESSIINHESMVVWHGDDNSGRQLPAGVYLLKCEGYSENRKIVMVR
jgi:hypothetical protein